MVGDGSSLSISFRGEPYLDAKTGDVVIVAYLGLRFIRCRIKRSALKPLTGSSVPSDAEVLEAFCDYRARIEKFVEAQVRSGDNAPLITDLGTIHSLRSL
jgi:hypothetical protein